MQKTTSAGTTAGKIEIPDAVASVTTPNVSAERVYGALADLNRHTIWGGSKNGKRPGLLSLDAPAGAAIVGTEFRSTGIDLGGTFSDRSVVTEASRPRLFEFVTEGTLTKKKQGRLGSETTFTHRYEIAEHGAGCVVTYRGRAVRWTNPPFGLTSRVLRPIIRMMFASMAKRTLRNLIASADQH